MTARKDKSEGTSKPRTSKKRARGTANKPAAIVLESLPPGLGQPAYRALAAAGYVKLEQFTKVKERELLKLRGMGPKAMGIIRAALKDRGLSFLS